MRSRLLVVSLLVVLSGCSVASTDPAPLAGDPPAPEVVVVAEPVVMEFGEVGHEFPSGVTVAVTAESYTPEITYPSEPGPFVVLRVTVGNEGVGALQEPDGVRDVTSGGQPVRVVNLGGEGALSQDTAALLPGSVQAFDRVVVVDDAAAELVVTVADPAMLDGSEGPLGEVYFRGVPT